MQQVAFRQKLALVISFAVMSFFGYGFIFSYTPNQTGVFKGVVFVLVMAIAHLVGYLLYKEQLQTQAEPKAEVEAKPHVLQRLSLREPLYFAIGQQLFLFFLTALLLDGGRANRVVTLAILAHWVCIGMILIRRHNRPTLLDTMVVKYGLILLILCVANIPPVVHQLIGK